MAKFLDSAAAAFHLEELIVSARERLTLVTPQLKFSGRAKDLLAEKERLDLRVVYARCELHPHEIDWLRGVPSMRTHFCRSLTAKAYLNESACMMTSLDLYDFGQVMNEEIGVLITRADDPELYRDAMEEVDRIINGSDEVLIRVDKVDCIAPAVARMHESASAVAAGKLSTHRLAKKLGLKTHELLDGLQRLGAIEVAAGQRRLTPQGMKLGGEFRSSARFGEYFVWPENFELAELASCDAAGVR
ncbi:MAG: DNA repair protein [Verrucomicrobiota bacterium]|nr:DNA repair protein [Verrucomicrobiota bacterium]